MSYWSGIGLVLVTLGSTILLLQRINRRYELHPELVRKLLHLTMGLVVLALPWLFDQLWPVLVLATLSTSGLWILRKSGWLKCRLSGVIDGVERSATSYGEIWFPLGICGLFILSQGKPLQYSISVLMLTAADPAAALVGVRYGRRLYTTPDGSKSIEGSSAFLAAAFTTALLPLLWTGVVGTVEAFLISLILGLLLTVVEAIAWRGSDNLFIPVVSFLLLNTLMNLSLTNLTVWIILTGALVIFVMRRYDKWNHIGQHKYKPTNSSTNFANPLHYRP